MSENLKDKTAGALLWGAVNNGTMQLLNLAFGICLSRLLDVTDYGMVGMLTIFALIATSLQESGFFIALGNKKEVTHRDYNAVFWFNICVSASIYTLLFFCAPLIADFYDTAELVPLARYVFLGFLIGSFGIVHSAYLYRHLMARERAIATLTALLISGITGVTLAYMGFAYWGIATQNIVYILVTTLLYMRFSRWRPTFSFSFAPIREMFGFSSKLLVTNIFTHLNNNLLSVLLGRFYDAYQVGLFNQANKWNTMGHSTLTGIVNGVAIPTFREVTGDTEREQRVFRKMLRFTAFISFPGMFGLALVAPQLIHIAITDKWIESAYFLRLLAVGGAFLPIIHLYTHFIISRGKTHIYMWCTIAQSLVQLLSMFLLYPYGTDAMVFAYVCIGVSWLLVWHYFLHGELGIGLWTALRNMAPFALTAVFAVVVAGILTASITNAYPKMFAEIAIAGTMYLSVMYLLRIEELYECMTYFRKKKSSR